MLCVGNETGRGPSSLIGVGHVLRVKNRSDLIDPMITLAIIQPHYHSSETYRNKHKRLTFSVDRDNPAILLYCWCLQNTYVIYKACFQKSTICAE